MPPIRFYNTLTHRIEGFEPIDPPHVYMYNCGPTVYDYTHIGNFRTFIFADLLRRFLELVGLTVHQVMNVTDVGHMTEDQWVDGGGEDKMQVAADRLKQAKKSGRPDAGLVENPDDPYEIADYYTSAFLSDGRALGLKVAEEYPQRVPRASQHVERDMIPMIRDLVEKGHAYVAADGAVYYSVRSFPDYGRLSGNTLDQLQGGAGGRVKEEHQAVKRHPGDFLLWKPDAAHLMKWDSPWGTGYPGWHIECSAMATGVLGREVIDIHTGGEDNIFPHHECEIAQTCGATGRDTFARFWMHARYLLVDGQKMSKSRGNFYTVRDVLGGKLAGRPVDPLVLRYELLKTHYRSNLNFTNQSLADSALNVRRIREVEGELIQRADGAEPEADLQHPFLRTFVSALSDDMNMAGALAELFEFLRGGLRDAAEALAVLRSMDRVLGVLRAGPVSSSDDRTARTCRLIDQARAEKDFATADRLRRELIDAGFEVRTTPDGTTATKMLA